ncbi:hypothetical protein IMG5_003400 [Ichthyophthirius multifiliis]|uniref:Uncharacterized protein n=1 Tax=Ichthyophthirius multifiliis TaxID=5932 RepID=G0QJ98_ICHMU|nr:hypothetical protein IMG5_003400 [Ichthyophthirius multifiliis]EGR34707.1 hypothetical protein IMG5_003400 [Ichthyophthirius multifiliis]|eukprot:XP_004040011.1 hypothetical protein IMG5_003400 [Ichthyophthirius multifiliis]
MIINPVLQSLKDLIVNLWKKINSDKGFISLFQPQDMSNYRNNMKVYKVKWTLRWFLIFYKIILLQQTHCIICLSFLDFKVILRKQTQCQNRFFSFTKIALGMNLVKFSTIARIFTVCNLWIINSRILYLMLY